MKPVPSDGTVIRIMEPSKFVVSCPVLRGSVCGPPSPVVQYRSCSSACKGKKQRRGQNARSRSIYNPTHTHVGMIRVQASFFGFHTVRYIVECRAPLFRFWAPAPPRPGRAVLARFARESAGHQRVTQADLPTKVGCLTKAAD